MYYIKRLCRKWFWALIQHKDMFYQYKKYQCGSKMAVISLYLRNRNSYYDESAYSIHIESAPRYLNIQFLLN